MKTRSDKCDIQAIYITNLCSFYQHNVKNAQKRKWLSPNERKYAVKSKQIWD